MITLTPLLMSKAYLHQVVHFNPSVTDAVP
jgi:hypothetical protein